MNTFMIRQGDLLIVRIDSIPQLAAPRVPCVLALGEGTGHSHRIEAGAQLYSGGGGLFVEVFDESATLVHEEHGPVSLARGLLALLPLLLWPAPAPAQQPPPYAAPYPPPNDTYRPGYGGTGETYYPQGRQPRHDEGVTKSIEARAGAGNVLRLVARCGPVAAAVALTSRNDSLICGPHDALPAARA